MSDMEAKHDELHDASATDSPVDSDVPTHVIVDDDDAVEVRQSTMTLQVDDDLVKLASQLSAANKVRLLNLLLVNRQIRHGPLG